MAGMGGKLTLADSGIVGRVLQALFAVRGFVLR